MVQVNNSSPETADSLSWVGKVQHKLHTLKESKVIALSALVHQVGVYDLNQIAIESLNEDE